MTELFNIIFQSFWHFLGSLILISAILEGINEILETIINAFRSDPPFKSDNYYLKPKNKNDERPL